MILALEGTAAASGSQILANVLPAFLLVIGAPLGIWWWMRRGRKGSTARLKITDKAALGRNVWIAVAEIDGQRFLLGAGEQGVGLLSELEAAPAVEAATALDPADATTEVAAGVDAMDRVSAPRMGLVRRLQLMTLRTSAPHPRSFDAPLG